MTERGLETVALRWWAPPLAGALFALAYPPLDLLPFAVVGMWPLFAFLDGELEIRRPGTLRRAFAGGYLFGLTHFGALLYWIAGLTGFSVMAVPAYVASTMIMALNGGLAALGAAFAARRGVPLVAGFPLAWVGVEWLRSFGDLGFTWAVAGDAVAGWPVLVQSAELGGAYLVSLWLVALSAAGWRVVRPRVPGRRVAWATVAAVLAVAAPLHGWLRMADLERAAATWPTFRAAAIQPNVPQDMKWDPAFEDETHRRLAHLTGEALEASPSLVVWPESAVPGYLRYDPGTRALVTSLARAGGTPILTGTNDADTLPGRSGLEAGHYRVFNAAYLVEPDTIVPRRYAKRRLVPVAERVPFLPGVATGFFERLSSWTGQFAPGEGWTTWAVDGVRFGVLVCYESVFPSVSRSLVRAGADFLVNITNDAWFGRTAAPYQHASHLTLRSVEHRVSFLRSANTGISGWVDPLGRWHDATPLYEQAVVVAELPLPGLATPYTRWGDWLPALAVLAWGAACILTRRFTRSSRDR